MTTLWTRKGYCMNSSERPEDRPRCGYQENLALLRTIDFFSVIPLDTLKVVALMCSRETYKEGDYLFYQGDDDGQAFYFISGRVEIRRGTDQETPIRSYEPEDFIGSLSLLGTMRRLYSARVMEETTCLVLTREKFEKAVEQFPNLMDRIVRILIHRIQAWEERFISDCLETCEHYKEKVGVSLL